MFDILNMSESYVDTKILECSQRSSVQFDGSNTSNNALFMNKVDEGMMLNPGDKVSLHSAVISQIGAGGDTIELKGNFLKRIRYDNIVDSTPYTERNDYLDSGYKGVLNREDAITLNNTHVERNLYDNNLIMGIEYYKAANGENCFSLPRRFAFSGTRTYAQRWADNDSVTHGAPFVCQVNGGIVETDYHRDRNSNSVFNTEWENNRELLKVRQDGKKFTIFHRLGTTFYNASATQPSVPNLNGVVNGNGSIDPAVGRYWLHRELKEVEIPKGRRAADFIAERFTDGLQNASDLQQYYYYRDENNNPSVQYGYANQSVLGAVYKTDTYKPFNCHNGSTFSETNYNNVITYDHAGTGAAASVTQSRLDWVNGFQYVSFKRPDLVFPARQYWNSGSPSGDFSGAKYQHITNVNDDNYTTGYTTMKITLLQSYNELNCSRMAQFIKAQGLYPELWDFRNASSPYYNRTEVSTQIQTNSTYIGVGATSFQIYIDPGDTPLTFDRPRDSVIKRTITVTGPVAGGLNGLEPATCNVTSIVGDGSSGFQTVHIDGEARVIIPSGEDFTFTITDTLVKLSPDNSRFIHIDMIQKYDNASKTLAVDRKDFGSDLYHADASGLRRYSTCSEPLWVTYIKDQEDEFFDEPVYNDREKKLSFGIFSKGPSDRIQFITEGVGGVPEHFYNASGFFIGGYEAVGNGSYQEDKYMRFCGYDPHFTGYGNAALGLYTPSAMIDMGQNLTTGLINTNENGAGTVTPANLSSVINQIYLGSSNPKLTYDPTKDRFAFTDFYTPEYLGNDGGAGQADEYPANTGPQVKVYKINKRLRRTAFCPGMIPYEQKKSITAKQTDGSKTKAIFEDIDNRNIFPFSIMDCHSGISIDHLGITEDVWESSLLGILGFSYNQLNASVTEINTAQNRVNTFNIKSLNKLTTSAEIKAEDTLFYHQNVFGNTLYQPNVLSANVILDSAHSSYYTYNAPISVDSPSLSVTADNVPRSMLFPFYTIKTDLIDVDQWRGGGDSGERLPVIGHVTKQTDGGDFFYTGDSSVEFTITKSKPITSITTAITDPDGTFSELNDNSVVLYKVQKSQQLPINILAEIMKGQKK